MANTKGDPKWTEHKEMTDHRNRSLGPDFVRGGEGTKIPPVHTFGLLNTPFGKDVEMTIETADDYVDRS